MFRRIFFNFWYLFRRPPWDSGISPPELLRFLETHPSGRALDLGCGTGTNIITLAKAGWHATGVDFASGAIARARKKARAAGISADFHVGDVTRLEFPPHSFDLILDMGCFHGLAGERTAYARGVQTWLSPGGTYLLYAILSSGDSDLGITEADLGLFSSFTLAQREEGMNPGPVARPSAWFTFTQL